MNNKNSFAPKPPLGWNSWDCYGASVREDEIRANAKFIAENLKQYGWHYVTVDIQWSEPTAAGCSYHNLAKLCMDEYGRLIPAPNRFPSSEGGAGFGPLADYVHSLGLGFGIHIMRGIPRQAAYLDCPVLGTNLTARDIARGYDCCPWNMDMYGVPLSEGGQAYFDSIIALYAGWGVDFIKCDDLSGFNHRDRSHFHTDELVMLRRAIDKSGRAIVLSTSPGTANTDCAEAVVENANMWRISGDFWDNWDSLRKMYSLLVDWNPHMGEGHFPDADMLPLGRLSVRSNEHYNKPRLTSLTPDEQRFMMSLWSVARSPLILGGALSIQREDGTFDNADDFTMSIITNKSMLDCDQNSSNNRPVDASLLAEDEGAWTADAADGGKWIALFNMSDGERAMSTKSFATLDGKAVDVWSGAEYAVCDGAISVTLPAHAGTLVKIS